MTYLSELVMIFLQYDESFHDLQAVIIHNNFSTLIPEYNVIQIWNFWKGVSEGVGQNGKTILGCLSLGIPVQQSRRM